jgi:hypothetical protein
VSRTRGTALVVTLPCFGPRSYNHRRAARSLGGMAERTNALVLKTSGGNTPVGSNPTAPAQKTAPGEDGSLDLEQTRAQTVQLARTRQDQETGLLRSVRTRRRGPPYQASNVTLILKLLKIVKTMETFAFDSCTLWVTSRLRRIAGHWKINR